MNTYRLNKLLVLHLIRKCITFLAIIIIIPYYSCSSEKEDSYIESEKEIEVLSTDYKVWINNIETDVYTARVQDFPFQKEKVKLDFGGNYSFVSFDIDGITEIKIRSSKKNLDNTIIRPDHEEVTKFSRSETEISFTIEKPIKLSIEPDGKNSPLLLFANPVIDYFPNKTDNNTIYYGPGVHKPENGVIKMRDGQTLYLEEGAIVKAGVLVAGDDITICGRGILCGNEFVWGQGAREMVSIKESSNIIVKDIIVRGSAAWTIPIRNSNNITIDNVKILGGRAQNDDGINPCNSQDVLIKNCFIRTDDDCITPKGTESSYANVERITVENSILWCDRARIFLFGHKCQADYMRDIKINNIDVIHFGVMDVFLLEPGEGMKLQNVEFNNIRIYGEGQERFIRLKPTVIEQYMNNKIPGYINNISFNNIILTGTPGNYLIELTGADEKHTVTDVQFNEVFILGNIINEKSNNLKIGDHVHNVSFND